MKKILFTAMITLLVLSSPMYGISPRRHPNLARAQRDLDAAYKSIVAAQRANEFDLDGHAAKAKELLESANSELKKAAEASNDKRGQ